MSNLRERPRNGTSSLEDDVILLAIRQAFVEWGQQFEVGRLKSLDERMTRLGAELRELKRAQSRTPSREGPQTMKSIDERNQNGDQQ
jgi:hypothetical protein